MHQPQHFSDRFVRPRMIVAPRSEDIMANRPATAHSTTFRVSAIAMCALLLAAVLTAITTSSSSAATDPCGTGGNKITCENSKPGTPQSQWDINGAGDSDIQGFATDISVNVGKKIDFKIDTNARAYTIDIYRTGYYGGDGARKIASVSPSATLPQSQPQCITDTTTYLYDCGNWAVSASWTVPSDAVSGVYIAKLTRTDNTDNSHITFIVRDDSSQSDVVFQTSDPTWEAYNTYGGSDFYAGGGNNGRAYKISYNRPFNTRSGVTSRDFYMSSEYATVRFMEKNGYDVSYLAGVDSDRNGALIKNHKVFMSVGHDEYVSKAQRANIESARDAGVNLMFLSGNEVYWKTRYEASADASNTAYRTLTSYKETWSNAKIDPSDEWTGTWRDPRFAPKDKGGGMPENGLTGTIFMSNYTDLPVTVSAAEGKLRLWRNSGLQSMSSGQTTALAPHTVGYESDEDLDNGSRPQGLIRLSTVSGAVTARLLDFGSTTGAGTTTHHLTMYKAPSGALVFSAGSIQWAWGLDATHDGNGAAADKRMQQAQVNLFADMSAQPASLDPSLTAATKSTDTTAPTATISTPAANATIANGTKSPQPERPATAAAGSSPGSKSPPTTAAPGTRQPAPPHGATPTSSTATATHRSRSGQSTTAPISGRLRPGPSRSIVPAASSAPKFRRRPTPTTAVASSSGYASLRQVPASSPASGSTRLPATPELTPEPCGATAERSSRPSRSAARRRPAGRARTSPRPLPSPAEPPMSSPTPRRMGTTPRPRMPTPRWGLSPRH